MAKRILYLLFLLINSGFISFGQSFDQVHALIRERENIKASYDKIAGDAKASKSKKAPAELQATLEKLMAKDAEIIQEIAKAESAAAAALEAAGKKETIKTVYRGDKSQNVVIDSLAMANQLLQARVDSIHYANQSNNSYTQTLQNEVRSLADEKSTIQKELDSVKADKFILARRNWILLFFNVGVAILLTLALVYTIVSLRKRKSQGAPGYQQEVQVMKPRPITGFNTQINKVAFDAYDNKLEKIEMLGRLREKGLITDDEFIMQKQQLLTGKNKD